MANGSLSFGQCVLTSLSGMALVFAILAALALATLAIARLLGAMAALGSKRGAAAPPPDPSEPAAAVLEEEDELGEVVAVLHGALSMASGIPIDQMAIVSITSLPPPEAAQGRKSGRTEVKS